MNQGVKTFIPTFFVNFDSPLDIFEPQNHVVVEKAESIPLVSGRLVKNTIE